MLSTGMVRTGDIEESVQVLRYPCGPLPRRLRDLQDQHRTGQYDNDKYISNSAYCCHEETPKFYLLILKIQLIMRTGKCDLSNVSKFVGLKNELAILMPDLLRPILLSKDGAYADYVSGQPHPGAVRQNIASHIFVGTTENRL